MKNSACLIRFILLALPLAFTWNCTTAEDNAVSFIDPRDGQEYPIVTIGTQKWMGRNLNYTPASGAFWYYNNDSVANSAKYGRLYDWATAMTVAPAGWHLPTDPEWQILIDFLGSDTTMQGAKLRDTTTWNVRADANNETGFSGEAGGDRYWQTGVFYSGGDTGYWWTATTGDSTHHAFDRDLDTWNGTSDDAYTHVHRHSYNKGDGFSVRCVKD